MHTKTWDEVFAAIRVRREAKAKLRKVPPGGCAEMERALYLAQYWWSTYCLRVFLALSAQLSKQNFGRRRRALGLYVKYDRASTQPWGDLAL